MKSRPYTHFEREEGFGNEVALDANYEQKQLYLFAKT